MLDKFIKSHSIDWPTKFKEKLEVTQNSALLEYYKSGLPSIVTPIDQVVFLAMDFETTGLDSNDDDIITIGTVPFTIDRIMINKAKHWTVKPRKQLPEESVVIHGITHSDILDAPDLLGVYQEVLEQMAGKVMVVHYQRIERDFFDKALKARISEGIEFPVIDTMQLETIAQQKITSGFINRLKRRQPESVRLGASRSRYGLPLYPPHHALTDAVATAELLQAQIAHHYQRNMAVNQLWI